MAVDPLVVEFEVAAPPDHAFDTWTRRCGVWWPRAHTVSGDPASIMLESRRGGRIFERARDGTEHDWGEILEWDPPRRLRYRWHLFFDPSEATEVEITFHPAPAGTAVRLEQRGWEHLGEVGGARREKTEGVWRRLADGFAAACG